MHAPLRLAELMGSLSLATDLADGFSLEKSLRTTVLAVRLARAAGSDDAATARCFWGTLLRFTGCTAFAHEEATSYAAGDDIALRHALAMVDFGRPSTFVARVVGGLAPGASLGARAKAVASLLGSPGAPKAHAHAQCEAGIAFAHAVGMPDVAEVLNYREERWDGRGPRGVAREEALPLAARVADVADVAELFAWHGGPEAAWDELRRRAGGSLDPRLVERFVAEGGGMFASVFATSVWEEFLASEPGTARVADDDAAVTRTLEAFARIADLASPYTLGHARRVADLAAAGADAMGLDADTQRLTFHAGLAHDLGRVAVPTGIWNKPAPLTPFERERVRTHSQHTETILRLAPSLHPIADIAGATHERGLGAGYHRRLRLRELGPPARLLAAANVWVALTSDRPHRARQSPAEATVAVRAMSQSGELDPSAVDAVLAAAGAPRHRRTPPAALSPREAEVVRLVAIGRTNPEIGTLLGISPRTAQHHVMNVYQKLGLESRAGLALYAVEHGLLD